MTGEGLFKGVITYCDIGIWSNFKKFELDNVFRSKQKSIFELHPHSDKVGRRIKPNIYVAASTWEKAS